MDDLPIHKIQISGPTLASLLHRFSSSPSDTHGLLFGHVTHSTPSSLSDDPSDPSSSSSLISATTSHLVATVTSFLSLPSNLPLPLSPSPPSHSSLLGSFSARRRTPSRPSLKDSTNTLSLFSNPTRNEENISLPPSLFLLLTTPIHDQVIHTQEYRMFQYSLGTRCFEPKSLHVVNIGPSFRANYEAFVPNSPFPFMGLSVRDGMVEDDDDCGGSLKDQKALDGCAEGFEIGKLGKLMASGYSGELEDLYDKMLAKLHALARLVEKSDIQVLQQENHNMKLRRKIAGLE